MLVVALGLAAGFILGALRAAGGLPVAQTHAAGPARAAREPSVSEPALQAADPHSAHRGRIPIQAVAFGVPLSSPPGSPKAALPGAMVESMVAAVLDGRDPASVVDQRTVVGDLIPGAGDEVILGVTLATEEAEVALFRRTGPSWALVARVGGFAAIDGLAVVPLTGDGGHELLVYEDHDERTGAFYRRRALTILKWRRDRLVPVWSGTLYEEMYSLEPPLTVREVTAVDVRFAGGELMATGSVVRSRLRPDGGYEDESHESLETRWRWAPEPFRFVLQK